MKSDELLTTYEIMEVVKAAAKLGIRKIKLTGGEPLLHKDIVSLVKEIKMVPGIKEVTMTTNGVLLSEKIVNLAHAGLDGINISLDTLDRKKYQRITRHDALDKVLLGFHKAISFGLKTKINCLPLGRFNEKEIVKIASLAREYKIDVRFIELMPIGYGKYFECISYTTVKEKLEKAFGKAECTNEKHGNGPAIYYNFQDFCGSIGFISAISNEFCEGCNRIRLTADGKLKLCLHYNQGVDLKEQLRNNITDEELVKIMEEAIYHKPNKHCFNQRIDNNLEVRNMVQIGG
jgi:cyclic pyranopterin phosphate synthase